MAEASRIYVYSRIGLIAEVKNICDHSIELMTTQSNIGTVLGNLF